MSELRPGLLPKGSRLSRLFWEGASSPRTKLEQQKRPTWSSVLALLLTDHRVQADVQADNLKRLINQLTSLCLHEDQVTEPSGSGK